MFTPSKKIGVLLLSLSFALPLFSEGNYVPLVLSGYNADLVCESDCSGMPTIDKEHYFYSAAKKAAGAIPQTLVSKMGVTYNLAPFGTENSLLLKGSGGVKQAVLTLSTPTQMRELWFLGLSADKQRDIEITVGYTDNTLSEKFKISFPDWFQATSDNVSYYGLGRIKTSGVYDERLQFSLYERIVPVNSEKTVKSINVQYTGTDGSAVVIAVSALISGERDNNELYMVANAHFDTQYDWDVQTSIDENIKKTLEGNFNLFKKYPAYQFNFEGAIKYMFAKEYYPQLYEELKGYVSSGNWHISGGSIDANDVMVPSAESIIRNFLLGQEFYKKEFGRKGGDDMMLPDCFGFPYSLPTLGKHCGIVGFHTQKLSWGSAYNYDDLPHFGLWQGVDGSQIYAALKGGSYMTEYKENLAYNYGMLNEISGNKAKFGVSKALRYFGTGDRGGSVTEETVDWLEKSKASTGFVNVKVVTPDQFFESITPTEHSKLLVWNNELPMKEHGVGCYTSQTILKYWNRKGELLADATEKSSVLADWIGGLPYQSDIIRDSWIRLLWHQFHDDLTGTSIPKAYVYTRNDLILGQLDLSRTLNNAAGAISRKMNTQVVGIPIVVYNPLSIQREDIVEAAITLTSQPSDISIYNSSGDVVPAQIINYKNGVLSFIFKADVPSLGYTTYDLRLNDDASSKITSTLQTTQNTIENNEYVIALNQSGDIQSIIDKKQGNKELLKSPIRLSMQLDKPEKYWSWEISWTDNQRTPYGYVNDKTEISISEKGPLRSALKISRTKNGSQFVQYVRMTSGVNEDRIDFVNEVDWQSKETLLKVEFPLTVNNEKATYDISIGTIERGNRISTLHEVAGHQWADMTHNDKSYGISILNDCKYGWDKVDNNTIRLTLIHTPGTATALREYQRLQDLGLNKFTYSFYRHMNEWNETTQWQASKLNQPLMAYEAPKHEGTLGKSFEFVKLNTEKVAIKALKKAEASNNMIIRVYELTGENHDNVEITFPANIMSAKEVNGLEEEMGNLVFFGNKISFNITKYQPKTFAVKLADYVDEKFSEPSSTNVDLEYNIDVMSSDSKKTDGRFGSSNFVYPSELFSNEIMSDGVKFKVGPRQDGLKNAIQCEGQEINLPQATSNKKLYILAASQNINGSSVEFLVDGIAHSVSVSYFAEYVGTWGTAFAEQSYRKENVAFTATHRHNYSQNKNDAYSYLYIYKYMIPIDGNAKKLTLPEKSDVIVFAASVSDNENDDATPITKIYNLPEYEDIVPEVGVGVCGMRLIPKTVTASGYTKAAEAPEMAIDNDSYTKWCDNTSTVKTLTYTFEKDVKICQWNVLHAGLEGDSKITSGFKLQAYNTANQSWNDIDIVTNNTQNKTARLIGPFITNQIRLYITKEEQDGVKAARIYSFDVYGSEADNTNITDAKLEETIKLQNYPNPFAKSTIISCTLPLGTNKARLNIYDLTGNLVSSQIYQVAGGENQIVWNNSVNLSGMYFYTVSAISSGSVIQQGTGKMLIE